MVIAALRNGLTAAGSVILILLAFNLVITFVPQSRYRAVAWDAVKSGALPATVAATTPTLGPPRDNKLDCLIVSMLLTDTGETRLYRAISPSIPVHVGPAAMCHNMVRAISDPGIHTAPYRRYIHGYFTLAGLMLALFPMKVAALLLYLSLAALCIALAAARSPAFAGMSLGAVLFIGMDSFGSSFAFGPADLAILAALVYWSRNRVGSASAALLGAVIAAFEFLTGAAPVAAAAILASCAFRKEAPYQPLLAFAAAFLFAFLIKWGIAAAAWGPRELSTVGVTLSHWMLSDSWSIHPAHETAIGVSQEALKSSRFFSYAFALAKMVYFSLHLGGPLALVGTAVIPLLSFVYSSYLAVRDRSYTFLVAAHLAVMGWHFVFVSHTIVHAYFMYRTLGWLAVFGCGLVAQQAFSRARLGERASA